MKNTYAFLTLFIFIGCVSGNSSKSPQETLEYYLTSCASADTIGVNSISILEDYLLIKSWTIRRISEPVIECIVTLEMLTDSIHVLKNALNICDSNIEDKKDSLRVLTKEEQTLIKLKEQYEYASQQYEIAHNEIQRGYVTSKNLDRAAKWGMARDKLIREYLNREAQTGEMVRRRRESINYRLAELTDNRNWITGRIESLDLYRDTIEASNNHVESVTQIEINHIFSIIDLEIAGIGGIALSNKYKIEMLSANTSNNKGKWVISNLAIIGEL